MASGKSSFVYVTYIRTTPERLWEALTTSDFMKSYWLGMDFQTDWTVGSPWRMMFDDGSLADSGQVVELDRPRRIVLSWRNEWRPDLRAEGYGTCVIELEPREGAVKLTVTHSMERESSQFVEAVSGGWPQIISNLKSLLETGEVALAARAGHEETNG
jgi:uncharacterized protein YndB with AHSA1/START domain